MGVNRVMCREAEEEGGIPFGRTVTMKIMVEDRKRYIIATVYQNSKRGKRSSLQTKCR